MHDYVRAWLFPSRGRCLRPEFNNRPDLACNNPIPHSRFLLESMNEGMLVPGVYLNALSDSLTIRSGGAYSTNAKNA